MRLLQELANGIRGALKWVIAASLTLATAAYSDAIEWQLQQDEGRIQIYTRPVADSPFVEVKAVAQINAPIELVAAAMGTGDGCGKWRSMCKSSRVLSTLSSTEQYVYLVLDMPWPIEDRDMVIHSIADINMQAKTVNVQLHSASSQHPEQDYVRALSNGQYQIKALAEEQVEFTYIIHTDLGGDLPANIINPRVAAATLEDIKRLQTVSEQ